jgi:signal transduction histidine kinase
VPQKPDPRFLAITAHDLRGAVGVLDGAMKELTRELSKDNADAAKLTSMMSRSAQRLLLLGDRLSALGKLMDGSELEMGEPSDVAALVKDAANRAFAAHARRNLKLRLEGAAVSVPLHAQSLAGAVAELTALFCSFSQQELLVRVSSDAGSVRISFASDNASESVQRALRDRSSTTQANAGIAFAESVIGHHAGTLELSENDGSSAAISLVLPRHQ